MHIRVTAAMKRGVELRGNRGEPSIASASAKGGDGREVNTVELLEKVLQQGQPEPCL